MTRPYSRLTGTLFVALAAALCFRARLLAQDLPPDFLIRLERTVCFGECPAYSVTIDALGNVTYVGDQFVRVKGAQTDRIPVSSVAALSDQADRLGFFALKPEYSTIRNADGSETTVTDMPTTVVTITRDGRSKRVSDYLGAPGDLRVLEDGIDKAARTRRWVRIDEPTLRQLVQDGQTPAGPERTELFRTALTYDDTDVVRVLLEVGVPANASPEQPIPPLLMARSAAAVRLLLQAGADPSLADENGDTALGRAAYLEPEVTAVLLEAGASVDQACDTDGRTPVWVASCAGNIGAVTMLLKAGANPSLGPAGESALDCTLQSRDYFRAHPDTFNGPSPFLKDFDATVALLERALVPKKR